MESRRRGALLVELSTGGAVNVRKSRRWSTPVGFERDVRGGLSMLLGVTIAGGVRGDNWPEGRLKCRWPGAKKVGIG